MAYVDGLPVASTVSVNDVLAIDQGGTPGTPGTSTTRQATLALILGGTPGTQYLPLIGGTLTGELIISAAGTGLNVAHNVVIGGTLGVTGAVSGAGITALFASPPPIGSTSASTAAFTALTMGSSAIRWGILPLAAGTPTTGGAGYVVGEVITLTGGAKVSVISVSGGSVTEFYVQQSGSYTTVPTGAVAQTSTSGSGTGFTCTPAFGPIAASIGAAPLSPGLGNFVLGYQAGNATTTGGENTLVGDYAGLSITTGGFNTAFGHRAIGLDTTGHNLTAVGNDAMRNTIGGVGNVAVGDNAHRNGSGVANVAIGSGGVLAGTDGGGSGFNAAITGSGNVAVGHGAMAAAGYTTASDNNVFGHFAGSSITTGGANQIWGRSAGSLLTTGTNNVIIGNNVASTTLVTGSSNILIGINAQTDTAAAGTQDTLKIQGNSATPAISGTDLNTSAPAITLPGSLTTPLVKGVSNLTLGTGSALATNATTGMIFIPSCAGTPSGSVGALGGVALIFDSTANKIWIGVAGTWKSVAVA